MRCLVLFFIFVSIHVSAQVIDILGGYIGTAAFSQNEKINFLTGKPENLYADFLPAQVIGFQGTKFITDKIQFVSGAEFLNTFKSNYSMQITKAAANIKYSLIAPDIYRVAPYLTGGANLALVVLNQASFVRTYKPDAEFSGANNVQITEIQYRESAFVFTAPVFGLNVGGGIDVNVYNNLSIFGEAIYNYNYATRSGLQNRYTDYNTSELKYTNITFGVKLYMY